MHKNIDIETLIGESANAQGFCFFRDLTPEEHLAVNDWHVERGTFGGFTASEIAGERLSEQIPGWNPPQGIKLAQRRSMARSHANENDFGLMPEDSGLLSAVW